MTFVSYAQNNEDVMLWRALRHIENGFYIDVGANHPSDDSVTKAFYERGWSGINIEPIAKHIRELNRARPRDINLQVAVGSENGEIEIFDTSVRGLATACVEVAQRHAAAGIKTVAQKVRISTLNDICSRYAVEDIHFLKIDVEGFEQQVLAGLDLGCYRPWILVVEATTPNTDEISVPWESDVLRADYRYVYFDGLNRFYVAAERFDELVVHFKVPPNPFDQAVSIELVEIRKKAEDLNARLQTSQEDLARTEAQLQVAVKRLADLEQKASLEQKANRISSLEREIESLRNSNSWRITAPLRWLLTLLKSIRTSLASLKSDERANEPEDSSLVKIEIDTALKQSRSMDLSSDGHGPTRFAVTSFPLIPHAPETVSLAVPKTALPKVRLTGHIEGHYSLAIVNRGLAMGLEQLTPGGVAFQPYHGQPYDEPVNLSSEQQALRRLIARKEDFADDSVVSIVHHYPIITDTALAAKRLIFFFWEETAVPFDVVQSLNDGFDGVLVASDFVRRALINSGCNRPVFVVPLGIDHLCADDASSSSCLEPRGEKPFRFLHVSSVFERKGPDTLLNAYFKAFSGDDAVELYIKTFPNPHNHIAEQLRLLSATHPNPPKVAVDESDLDQAGMLALYRSAHAMVLPTRGEGFNLPAAEALAIGLPVIVTGHGGHVDFATLSNAMLTPFRFSRSKSHLASPNACWVDANPVDLAQQMVSLKQEVDNKSIKLMQRRATGMRVIRDLYSWRECARAVQNSVRWLMQKNLSDIGTRRLAVFSPWQTRCGIAEYSQSLLAGLPTNSGQWQLKVYCDMRTAQDCNQSIYEPTWACGDMASIQSTLDIVAGDLPDVFFIQYQPTLFKLTAGFCQRLADFAAQGSLVLLELHATKPLLTDSRLSAKAIEALRQIDRILVHKVEDLNNLLALGLCDNVALMPLGVIQPLPARDRRVTRAELNIPEDALLIGSFGFALPHKGGDRLVEAVQMLAQIIGREVHLLGVNSILDSRSLETLDRWKQLARETGVENSITWVSDYQPIQRCQDLLALADYLVFPYQYTRESASAAVAVGLSTLKPVLVSPLEIFDDVVDCTWVMAGSQAGDIVSAIMELQDDPVKVESLRQRQSRWLEQRSFETVSHQLFGMLDGLHWQQQICGSTQSPQRQQIKLPTRRLYVDISKLYFEDRRTGIQRVVRSVLLELLANPPKGYEVCPVYAQKAKSWQHTSRFVPGGDAVCDYEEGQVIEPKAGDIFFGLDLSAHLFPEAQTFLHDYRLSGVRVFYVVYDIIPLRYPEYTLEVLHDAFTVWIDCLARQADGLLCISSTVAKDVRAWFAQNKAQAPYPDVRYFHLGADIQNSMPTYGRPEGADSILSKLSNSPVVLSVCTVEPRKGLAQTLAAFELLWSDGVNVNFVLVGKPGWMMDEFIESLRNHAELGRRLFWLEGVSDEFLDEIYGASDCLLAASHVEGFGLPLIEAALHGVPIIARDIEVFREVAGPNAYYFKGSMPEDLECALRQWLELYARSEQPRSADMEWLTWEQSVNQIKGLLLEDACV